MGPMDIGFAVMKLYKGHRVRREGWNGRGMYLEMRRPDDETKMTEPYVFLRTVSGGYVPWTCSQADLLADDWEVADDN